jgi:toxin ParE1/3/4
MAQIIWTDPALKDLNEIAGYIAISNLFAAKELTQKIFDKNTRL